MAQDWLNVLGLTADFFGVLLLASEWWIALSAERLAAERNRREAMMQPSPMMPRPNTPHQAVFDHMAGQRRALQTYEHTTQVMGMRKSRFGLAIALITLGFLCQLLGQWPGGLPLGGLPV